MNCLLLSLALAVGLGLLLSYSALNQRRAVNMREEMVDAINEALSRNALSEEGKRAAFGLFNASLRSGAVPRFILKMLWYRWHDRMDDLDRGITDKDYPILSKLIRKHVLPINFAAGPHWYLLLGTGLLLAAFFASVTGFAFRWTDAQRARIEHYVVGAFSSLAH